MNKCKITVIKRCLEEDLVKEYGYEGIGKCLFHKEGDVFYTDFKKPEGFAMRLRQTWHLSLREFACGIQNVSFADLVCIIPLNYSLGNNTLAIEYEQHHSQACMRNTQLRC